MDPADSDKLKRAITSQAALLNKHEATLSQVMEHLQQLSTGMTQLTGQLAAIQDRPNPATGPTVPPPAADPNPGPPPQSREPYIPIPARYGGDSGTCSQFLHQCSLVFSQQPHTYATHQARIAFVMSLLTGQAAAWSLAISTQHAELTADYTLFSEEMRRVFDHPVKGRQAVGQLLDLRQNRDSVSSYAIRFRILAAESGWEDKPLQAVFVKGLSGVIKDELALRDESSSLNQLIENAIKIDNRMAERQRERSEERRRRAPSSFRLQRAEQPPPSSSLVYSTPEPRPSSEEEPMQLGRTQLTPAERRRRWEEKLCLYCGKTGHFLRNCHERPKDNAHQRNGGHW